MMSAPAEGSARHAVSEALAAIERWQPIVNAMITVRADAGLPLSFELSAARFDEAAVLQLGHAWQRVTNHHLRQPALPQ